MKANDTDASREKEIILTPAELAGFLKVKLGTVYSWISRGVQIPCVRIGGSIRFRETAVLQWLIEKENEGRKRNFK